MSYFSKLWVSFISISNVLNKLLAFLFFVFLARLISTEDYGSFRYALTIATFFIIPISGIPFAMTRYVGKYISEPELAANYLFNSLVLGLSILISIIFLAYFIFDGSLFLILIISKAVVISLLVSLVFYFFTLIKSKKQKFFLIATFLILMRNIHLQILKILLA